MSINLIKPCAVVHTWLDKEKSEQFHRPVWDSNVRVCIGYNAAHILMKNEFSMYFVDNKESVIAAYLQNDCAYLEYGDGCKEIWVMTSDVEDYPKDAK